MSIDIPAVAALLFHEKYRESDTGLIFQAPQDFLKEPNC